MAGLPENARLFINGQPTTLTGEVRHFFASDLSTENRYAYDVREREIVRRLKLTGGKDLDVALDSAGQPAPVAATAALE